VGNDLGLFQVTAGEYPERIARLAALLPRARLVEITDSYTLIPEDQPAQLAAHIRAFIASEPVTAT
jgi:pimeloyl-ACP methyl ester carboxylesterase